MREGLGSCAGTTVIGPSTRLQRHGHASFVVATRDVHGNGIANGTGNPMGMGIKHRIGNGKPPQWEWELPAFPWEFIPKGFMLR